MELNPSNYYSVEANQTYMSASLIKSMLNCEAAAIAEARGEWTRPDSTALLVGSYLDAKFDSDLAFNNWMKEHPEVLKRDGTLKAEYQQAERMYERVRKDPVFFYYTFIGFTQHILTGEIDGVPFKAKLDFYVPDERIVDLKTVRSFDSVYLPGKGRVSFAEAWNWPLQMAIYQELEGHHLPCYLAVITKEDPCDYDVIEVPQSVMDAEMDLLRSKLPRLEAIWNGSIEPDRCGHCAYCRETKKLERPTSLLEYEWNE